MWGSGGVALVLLLAAPAAPAAAGGARPVCTVSDTRLTELSGMVRTESGFVVVNDGSDIASHRRVFFLNDKCAVVRAVRYPSTPRDTEDLGRSPDGTLWVADIGDNDRNRSTVGLWRLPPGASSPVLYRLSYPDGAHDAEALVFTGTGTPVIATKDIGVAYLYEPTGALRAGSTTPLKRVGEWRIPFSTTSNPFSFAGRLVVTGGANSPDGSRVVLRTYADAYEFPVTGGDVVRAITTGHPRAIPLPDEPQGESIAYDHDGASLLTVSEWATAAKPVILRYAQAPPSAAPSPASAASTGPAPRSTVDTASGNSTVDRPIVVILLGVFGLGVLVAVSVAVLRRRVRR